jgi:hypothetical protein
VRWEGREKGRRDEEIRDEEIRDEEIKDEVIGFVSLLPLRLRLSVSPPLLLPVSSYHPGCLVTTALVSPGRSQTLWPPRGSRVRCRWSR